MEKSSAKIKDIRNKKEKERKKRKRRMGCNNHTKSTWSPHAIIKGSSGETFPTISRKVIIGARGKSHSLL